MSSYTPKVKGVLFKHDCKPVRKGKGDHEIWYSPITDRHFPVDGNIKSRHTANCVLKQAGISKKF